MRNQTNRSRAIERMAAVIAVIASGGGAASAQPAISNPPLPVDLPAGTACEGFGVRVEALGGTVKTFNDATGNSVRVIQTGSEILFTNLSTQTTFQTQGRGSVTRTSTTASGMLRVVATGQNGLVMFPSDIPAGPTSTVYLGRIVYEINPATGVFTLVETKGRSIDVCAELAS